MSAGNWNLSGQGPSMFRFAPQTRTFTDSHDRWCWNQSEYHIPLHAKGSLHLCTISKHHTRGGSAGKYNLPHRDNGCTSVQLGSLFGTLHPQALPEDLSRRKSGTVQSAASESVFQFFLRGERFALFYRCLRCLDSFRCRTGGGIAAGFRPVTTTQKQHKRNKQTYKYLYV